MEWNIEALSKQESPGDTRIVLTIDLEDWKTALIRADQNVSLHDLPIDCEFLRRTTEMMLTKLSDAKAKATFFVVGDVLRQMPELIATIHRKGHEVAYHSPYHVPISHIPRNKLEDFINRDLESVESLTGERPIGFRAPYFSVTESDGWMIRILRLTGFKYDSSVVPSWTPLYGIPAAPRTIYRPDDGNLATHNPQGPIIEVPISTWPSTTLIPGIPLGGVFIRLLPEMLLHYAVRKTRAAGLQPVLYLHPGDLDIAKEKIKMALVDRLVQYAGLQRGEANFNSILKSFRSETVRNFLSKELDSE